MTADEIYSRILTKMHTGLSVHNSFASFFGLLNLRGYRRCHEYHFFEESHNYRNAINYILSHYNKLVAEQEEEKIEIIPASWYKYTKGDIDTNNKRSAIKEIMKKWIRWEEDVKKLLEDCYTELCEIKMVEGALFVARLLFEVGNELAAAREQLINLETINYDITRIIEEQDELFDYYSEKMGEENDDYE